MSAVSNLSDTDASHLIAALERTVESDEPLWVIVDPGSAPDHVARLRTAVAGESLFEQTRYARDDDVSPYVVPWRLLGEALKRTALSAAADHSAVMWFSTRLAAADVLPALRLKLHGRLADASAIVVRWFDPRVFVALREVLRPDQLTRIDSGISSWHLLDRTNAWSSFAAQATDATGTGIGIGTDDSIELDDAQVSRLLDASFDDRVLAMVRRALPAQPILLDRVQAYRLVQTCTASAFDIGLRSEVDCASFAALTLSLGAAFEHGDDWAPWIREIKSGAMSWGEAVRAWEERS
jgi:Domain of unknown function (DUF4123)